MTDTYEVQRSVSIDAPADSIYPLLADFRQWQGWSPWEGLDPDLQRTYGGAESGTGATYAWAGNRKAGEGRMEITDSAAGERVVIALDFLKPFKSSSTTRFELSGTGGATTVTWTMTGPKTLMTKIMGIFKSMDAMIGPDFEKGLTQLKGSAERQQG